MKLRNRLRFSNHWAARCARAIYYSPSHLSLPAPRAAIVPMRLAFTSGRAVIHFFRRVAIAEPMLKSYCRSYGKRVRSGIFVHWVMGRGDLILGNHVLIDGKCSFKFAARYVDSPTLLIGDHTGIGHNCSFTVGKQIRIGSHCRIASGVAMFDAPGHAMDPASRRFGMAAADLEVKPIIVGDNVWIGRGATIFPGVSIGNNSVIAAGAVVLSDVPENTLAGGNPARKIGTLPDFTEEMSHV
jgi:Hexapeptide repeat of succinyl-transferase